MENFEIYLPITLENLDRCLAVMPNLKRLKVDSFYAKDIDALLPNIVANISAKIEEITFFDQNIHLLKELLFSAKHRLKNLKTLEYREGEMKVRKHWASK